MRKAKMEYHSPLQTELKPLKDLLMICQTYGLRLQRDEIRGTAYRIVSDEEILTDYMTMAKLALWLDGFRAGIKYNQSNK